MQPGGDVLRYMHLSGIDIFSVFQQEAMPFVSCAVNPSCQDSTLGHPRVEACDMKPISVHSKHIRSLPEALLLCPGFH